MSRPAAKRASSPDIDKQPLLLQCTWSDGLTMFGNVSNGPTPEMMDQTRDENNEAKYMQLIEPNSKKEVDWLKKLGDSLVKEQDPALYKRKAGQIWFSSLPEGYRLFEQVQVRKTGDKKEKPRIDTYLYGHPGGPRKRYRSPADFTPHMIWLCCDEKHNASKCNCRCCKPTRNSTGGRSTSPVPESPGPSERATPVPAPRRAARAIANTRRGSNTPTPAPSTTPAQVAPAASSSNSDAAPMAPTTAAFAPMATPQDPEHVRDLMYPNANIFRVGEMVWAQTGIHWSIGVVVKAPHPDTQDPYQIQQLHSPLLAPTATPRAVTPNMIRPWVAWSTPPVTIKILGEAEAQEMDFEAMPWSQIPDSQTCEVDASIIKAKGVDGSYTLINCIDPGLHLYEGAYLGGERIWVGDAVRLKASANANLQSGNEIVVIRQIQDMSGGGETGHRSRDTGVFLTGDIYRQTTHSHPVAAPQTLPQWVLKDLEYRHRITSPNPNVPFTTFSLIAQNIEAKLEDVRGRWYPPAALFRIMNGEQEYHNMISARRWDEFGGKLNELGNSGKVDVKGWRRFEGRHQAFAHAIPPTMVFPPFVATQWNQWQGHGGIESGMAGLAMARGGSGGIEGAVGGEVVDLTAEDAQGNEGLEFLEDEENEDDAFMRTMSQDAASFIGDGGDGFYGGL